ncbi:MAG: class I SAM-dependent methyltransferase [Anaerolineae bacterium]
MPPPLVRFGFFLLYNHLAFTYDFVAWVVSWGQWARWRQTVEPFLKPGRTLELGFGTGGLFARLAETGRRPVGIDLSPFMARLTARRLRRRRLPLSIARAKAQSLPFAAGAFTNVIATFPTNYIFEPATLSEIHRVLTAAGQGHLLIVLQGRLKGPPPVSAVIEWLYRITGQRAFGPRNIAARFERVGFDITLHEAAFEGAAALLVAAKKQTG